MNNLLIISGPLISYGRTGSSWGKAMSDWDTASHVSIPDVLHNTREATLRGYDVVVVCWKEDLELGLVSQLGDVNVIILDDPFLRVKNSCSPLSNREESTIKKFGWEAKEKLQNDQRQLMTMKAGLDYGIKKVIPNAIRIRSDQKFDWDLMDRDFNLALSHRRLFFPAQKDFTALERDDTGFAVLDFFIGGAIQEVNFLVRLVQSQGRLSGPHYDLVRKYLPFNSAWSRAYPGLSTFRLNQSINYAREFWKIIAAPCSEENMNRMTWRGAPLSKITYNISAEKSRIRQTALAVEDQIKEIGFEERRPLEYSFDWRILSNYINGLTNVEPNLELKNYSEMYLDFAKHIGGHRNFGQLKVPIVRLAFRSSFILFREYFRSSRIWRVATRAKRLIFKNAG